MKSIHLIVGINIPLSYQNILYFLKELVDVKAEITIADYS